QPQLEDRDRRPELVRRDRQKFVAELNGIAQLLQQRFLFSGRVHFKTLRCMNRRRAAPYSWVELRRDPTASSARAFRRPACMARRWRLLRVRSWGPADGRLGWG